MSTILLIRHAQSANNALPEELRVSDPDITDLGRRQALATAQALSGWPVGEIYCSPFLRSLETTRAIVDRCGVQPVIRADLCEEGGCYSGHLPGQERGEPGMGRQQLSLQYPNWIVEPGIQDHGWWAKPFESTSQAIERAARIKKWLEQEVIGSGTRMKLLVIHADIKRHLLMQLLGSQWNDEHRQQLGPLYNAGISRLDFQRSKWILHWYNATSHLPLELHSA